MRKRRDLRRKRELVLRKRLATRVLAVAWPCGHGVDAGRPESLEIGDWERNDFSSCFWIRSRRIPCGVYVKCPKGEIIRRTPLFPTEEDRDMARSEYESLNMVHRHGAEYRGVMYVEPLAFFADRNALVTREVQGRPALSRLRSEELRSRFGASLAWGHDLMERIGAWLGRYHTAARLGEARRGRPVCLATKVQAILHEASTLGAGTHGVKALLARVGHRLPEIPDVEWTATLKGLDVRNVFQGPEGKIVLLDPGRTKWDRGEADVARFLTTWEIVFWGSPWFGFGLKGSTSLEEAFLSGYRQEGTLDESLVRSFRIKELAKHWRMASVALNLKRWGSPAKVLVRSLYVDRFYSKALRKRLADFNFS